MREPERTDARRPFGGPDLVPGFGEPAVRERPARPELVPGRRTAQQAADDVAAGEAVPLASPGKLTRAMVHDARGARRRGARPARDADGGGAPLPGELRERLESSAGQDLGGVRVHTGPDAAQAASGLDARAFAVGQDIYFGEGTYDPSSPSGTALIAHEVAHTVQQRGAAPADDLDVSDPADGHEREADGFAGAVAAGRTADVQPQPASLSRQVLQRSASSAPAPQASGVSPAQNAAVLSQASQRVSQAATTEKAAIRAAAESEQRAIAQEATAKAQAIEQATTTKVAALTASIDQKKVALKQTFTEARTAVTTKVSALKQTTQQEGTKALADLKKLIEAKQKAAKEAGEKEAKLLEAFGTSELGRANQERSATQTAIVTSGRAAVESIGAVDAKVANAVATEVNKAQSEALQKVGKQAQEIQQGVQKGVTDTAKALREGGTKLATELATKSAQVEKGVQDVTASTVKVLDAIQTARLAQLTELEQKAIAAIDSGKTKISSSLTAAGKQASTGARTAGERAAPQLQAAAAAQASAIDDAAGKAASQLGGAPTDAELDAGALGGAVDSLVGAFGQVRSDGAAASKEQAEKTRGSLEQLHSGFGSNLDQQITRIDGEIEKSLATARTELTKIPTQVEADAKAPLDEMRNAHKKIATDYNTEIQKKIDDAGKNFLGERQKAETAIRGDVDKGLAAMTALKTGVGPEFQKVADSAKASASSTWGAIWEGIKAAGEGMLMFLAVVVIAALVVAAVVGVAAFASIGAFVAAAFAVAGVFMLAYGLTTAIMNRYEQYKQLKAQGKDVSFVEAMAFAAGDAIGLTPLLEVCVGVEAMTGRELSSAEKWTRGTEVAINALTIIIGGLWARRGAARPGTVPLEKPPVVPLEKPPVVLEKPPVGPMEKPPAATPDNIRLGRYEENPLPRIELDVDGPGARTSKPPRSGPEIEGPSRPSRSGPEAEAAPRPRAEPEPAPQPRAEPAPQPRVEAEPAPRLRAEPEAPPQPRVEPEAQPRAEAEAPQPRAEPEAAPRELVEAEAAPRSRAQAEAAPQPRAEAEAPQPRAEGDRPPRDTTPDRPSESTSDRPPRDAAPESKPKVEDAAPEGQAGHQTIEDPVAARDRETRAQHGDEWGVDPETGKADPQRGMRDAKTGDVLSPEEVDARAQKEPPSSGEHDAVRRRRRYLDEKKEDGKPAKKMDEWQESAYEINKNRDLSKPYENEALDAVGAKRNNEAGGIDYSTVMEERGKPPLHTERVDPKTGRKVSEGGVERSINTKPDGTRVNENGGTDVVEHKHLAGDTEVYNDTQQARAQRVMANELRGGHELVLTSDRPPTANGSPPVKPSGPLGEASTVYYYDAKAGKVTHVWVDGEWMPYLGPGL